MSNASMTPEEELRQVLAALQTRYDLRIAQGMRIDSAEAIRYQEEYRSIRKTLKKITS